MDITTGSCLHVNLAGLDSGDAPQSSPQIAFHFSAHNLLSSRLWWIQPVLRERPAEAGGHFACAELSDSDSGNAGFSAYREWWQLLFFFGSRMERSIIAHHRRKFEAAPGHNYHGPDLRGWYRSGLRAHSCQPFR